MVHGNNNFLDRKAKNADDDSVAGQSQLSLDPKDRGKGAKAKAAAAAIDGNEQKNSLEPQPLLESSTDRVVAAAESIAAVNDAAEAARAHAKAKKKAAAEKAVAASEGEGVRVEEGPVAAAAAEGGQAAADAPSKPKKGMLAGVVAAAAEAKKKEKEQEATKDDSDEEDEEALKNAPPYECHLMKEQVEKIWKTPRQYLKSDEERKVLELLLKFNGPYENYLALMEQSNRRKKNAAQPGAHVQWGKIGTALTKDVDLRARQLLREIDRCDIKQYPCGG